MSPGIYVYNSAKRPDRQYNQTLVTQPPQTTARSIPKVTTVTLPPPRCTWMVGPLQQEPPKEFVPQMLDQELTYQKPSLDAIPAPKSAHSIKEDYDFKTFEQVDEHAMAVSHHEQSNFNQLIWQLIYSRNYSTDLDRVRAIFLWLCTKDLHQMSFDNITPGSPEEILMGIRTGKSTYAQIFQTLCRYANLHCKLLLGYAKGSDYSPGMRFTGGNAGQHSWNAVLVDGKWYLVDCHWAARRLLVGRASVKDVSYILDTFYFLTNPVQLIYTHFPRDRDWQLLRHPITLEEFERLPLVKSAFFKYKLNLVSHLTAVITVSQPEVRVVIGYPKDFANTLLFTIGLSFNDSELSEHYENTPLMRYAREEMVTHECCVAFYIRPPRPGAYKLLVYAKKLDEVDADGVLQEEQISIPDSTVREKNLYEGVCEYQIIARLPYGACLPPFPPCQTANYGPTQMFKRFNMTPVGAETSKATLRARGGVAEVRFSLASGSKLLLMAKLRCSLLLEENLTNCILQRAIKDGSEVIITVFLPDSGEFGLEVYANDTGRTGSSYFVIWQYLIISEMASPVRELPHLPMGYLGPAALFYKLGLQMVSHTDPFIQAEAGELRIQLSFRPQLPVKMMAHLIFATNDASDDYSQMVLQQMRSGQVYFVVRIPRLGFFKLQIYASPKDEENDSLPGVYNYLIEASKLPYRMRGQLMPFPQQFSHWRRNGCYLDNPTDGILGLDANGRLTTNPPANVTFCLSVPGALSVAVVVNEDWTYLKARGDRWEGTVSLRAHWGCQSRLSVCALYSQNEANFSTLLEYSLAY